MNNEKMELSPDMLDLVSGGKLEEGWQSQADQYIKMFVGTNDPAKVKQIYEEQGIPADVAPLIDFAKRTMPAEDIAEIQSYLQTKYGVYIV